MCRLACFQPGSAESQRARGQSTGRRLRRCSTLTTSDSHTPNYKVGAIHNDLDLIPPVSRAACPEQPCSLQETPPPPRNLPTHPPPGAARITEQMYVKSRELNKMTSLLISPRPECVLFFVSFIQNVQDPNKLYFLNLPSFCSVSFIKPPEGGPGVGGNNGRERNSARFCPSPPVTAALTVGSPRGASRAGVHFRKDESPAVAHCPEPSLRTFCASEVLAKASCPRDWPRPRVPLALSSAQPRSSLAG